MRRLLGIAALLAIAFALSEARREINWRVVLGGVLLQMAIAALFLKVAADGGAAGCARSGLSPSVRLGMTKIEAALSLSAMATFFTSDTHFGDTRILRAARRPFQTIAAHDAEIVARWQATVGGEDEVWHLGDVAPGYDRGQLDALVAQLPGRKHLVTGNNDDDVTRTHPAWASVHDYAEHELDGLPCILCHYPLRTWNGMGKGAIDLHGHSHNMLKPMTRQYDVGVDAFDFAPVTLATIRARRRRAPVKRLGSPA